jgi:endonuclease-8
VPEGDNLARIAVALRPYLAGRTVTLARARLPGPLVSKLVGKRISAVDSAGKNLLIRFEDGLALRTHLGLHGSWHRYRPGEPWRRPASRAALVLEVPGAVAVCFDAPVVELFEQRTEPLHPSLGRLGPDLLAEDVDIAAAVRRLGDQANADREIGEALLDQRLVAGLGNVYKSEVLFLERIDPFMPIGRLTADQLRSIVERGRELLVFNARAGAPAGRATTIDPRSGARLAPTLLWVYRRAGRPCHRCGALIRSAPQGRELPRTTYWCPTDQAPRAATAQPETPVLSRV